MKWFVLGLFMNPICLLHVILCGKWFNNSKAGVFCSFYNAPVVNYMRECLYRQVPGASNGLSILSIQVVIDE